MGWTDLFKSRPPQAKPDPRLRWFGKLPTYSDYYSSAVDEEWTVEFNEWILKGVELHLARHRAAGSESRLPSAACVLRLPKSGVTVLASIQDFGGDMRGRPFPICFYVGFPSALWPGPTSEHVLAALRVLRDLTALRPLVVHFMNVPGRFDDIFGGREIDLAGLDEDTRDGSWANAARAIPVADWWAAVRSGIAVGELDAWLPLVSTWGSTIASHESEEFKPTLRFPLAMSLAFEPQVAGWLRWLETKMKLEQRGLSLLVRRDPTAEVGYLSVVARELISEDFLLMTAHADSLVYLDDASALRSPALREEAVAQASGSVTTEAVQAVRAPATWAELVNAGGPE